MSAYARGWVGYGRMSPGARPRLADKLRTFARWWLPTPCSAAVRIDNVYGPDRPVEDVARNHACL